MCSWCKQPHELEDGEEPIRIEVSGINGEMTLRFHPECYVASGLHDIFEPFGG